MELTEQEKQIIKEWVESLKAKITNQYSENLYCSPEDSDEWDLVVDNEVQTPNNKFWDLLVNKNHKELSAIIHDNNNVDIILGEQNWSIPNYKVNYSTTNHLTDIYIKSQQ